MSVGFIHGVMNTNNMAISGETIDYGPCAFMDHYDPNTVFSFIDHGGGMRMTISPPLRNGISRWIKLERDCSFALPLRERPPRRVDRHSAELRFDQEFVPEILPCAPVHQDAPPARYRQQLRSASWM
jgi:hypothetical protein